MSFFLDGLRQAWELISSRDPYLMGLLTTTLKVAGLATAVAIVVGMPIGLALGLGRFRGRGIGLVLANVGLGLPPVVVGLVLALLMFPAAPLGRFHLLFTLNGVYIAQSVLAVPVVAALTASAVRDLPAGLVDQARALGAGRVQVAVLAARESRVGITASVIAALGSGLSEVGAVVLVGGNVQGATQTLASAALERVGAGAYAEAMAVGIILLGLILLITAALTWLQYATSRSPWGPRTPRAGRMRLAS